MNQSCLMITIPKELLHKSLVLKYHEHSTNRFVSNLFQSRIISCYLWCHQSSVIHS